MQLVRFSLLSDGPDAGTVRVGALLGAGELVLDLVAAGVPDPGPGEALAWYDRDGSTFQRAHELLRRHDSDPTAVERSLAAGWALSREACRLHAPIARPGKVICIGLNYRDHAAESGLPVPEQPVVFSKFPSCVIGPGDPIEIPLDSEQTDYEAEFGVVIGRRARNVPAERALEYVLGYVCINDVSARDFQFRDGQWQRGKSCETFCPMGEAIVLRERVPDPHRLRIQLHLNGRTLQDSNTDQLVFGVDTLIAFLSRHVLLEPGDVIATGTPPGVGFARKPPVYLQPGDECVVEIEGLGRLVNPVRRAPGG